MQGIILKIINFFKVHIKCSLLSNWTLPIILQSSQKFLTYQHETAFSNEKSIINHFDIESVLFYRLPVD